MTRWPSCAKSLPQRYSWKQVTGKHDASPMAGETNQPAKWAKQNINERGEWVRWETGWRAMDIDQTLFGPGLLPYSNAQPTW